MDDLLAHAGTGLLVCDETWTVVDATAPVAAVLGAATSVPADEMAGQDFADVVGADLAGRLTERLAEADGAVTVEEFLPAADRWVQLRAVSPDERTLVEVRDVSERAQLSNDLEGAREDRALLSRLTGLISELLGAVVSATTHEEIQEAVTSQLATTDLFELAWVGDWAADREGLSVRAAAGGEELLDAVLAADQESPERHALAAGDTEIVRDLASSEGVPESVRKAAFARGIQASIAVPLRYGETTFGVLGLYTARPDTLEEPGLSGIETLGEVVGFVLHATRQRQTLETATQRELVLALGSNAGPLARVANTTRCTLTLEGTATIETELMLAYISVSGGDPVAVVGSARDDAAVEGTRVVEEHDDGGLIEIRLGSDSVLVRLVGQGATIREATFEPDGGRVTVDVPPQTDVRTLLDRLSDRVGDVALQSTRTVERAARTTAAVEEVLAEELTERQRAALKTAYEAGYFASPRHSTASEIADSMGVSAPTFSHHLRVAQAKLLSACFE